MTVTDRFSGSALRFMAVLGAMAMTFALLPQAAGAQDPEDACPGEAPPEADLTDRDEIPTVHRLNVDCAAAFNIVQGFTDGTYRPSLQVRRDQMASFIANTLDAADIALPAGDSDTFDDVPDSNVHSDNVNRLAAADIVRGGPLGLDDDDYGPGLFTRRDQMTSFLIRAAGFALHGDVNHFDSTAQQFDDVPAGNVHFTKVNAAAENDITLGTGGGLFSPSLETRRDQMASFVVRLLGFILDAQEPSPGLSLALDPGACVVGQDITVTATATDADGGSAGAGVEVTFDASIDAGDTETTTATTDLDGEATATYTPEEAGTLTVTATATVEGEEVSATVTVNCSGPTVPETPNPALPGGATFNPEMTGAEIVETNPDNIRVRYTFDEDIATATADQFRIYTFDAGPPEGGGEPQGFSGTTRQISGNTVLVTFDQVRGNEASYFTVATVNFDAVRDFDGLPNPEADAPLFGAHVSGFTQAPDLVDVEFRVAQNQIDFVFDEPVDPASIPFAIFYLVDRNNNLDFAIAAALHPNVPNVVRAEFANITTNTEAITARAIQQGVEDFDNHVNVYDSLDVCCDGSTDHPDLVDVTIDQVNFEATFTFTEAVQVINPNTFFLVHFDSTFGDSTVANVDPANPTQVVAQYNPGEVERAVSAVVNAGSVAAVADINRLNSLDSHVLAQRTFVGGITNAPDLLDAWVEPGSVGGVGTTRGVYEFDQPVAPLVNADYFFVYDDLGNRSGAEGCERRVSDVSQVQCVFDADTGASDVIIAQGVLATVDNDETDDTLSAVRDHNIAERNNPEGATPLRH